MDETQAVLLFFSALLLGLIVGAAIGWWRGMLAGVAAGCLIIGLGASGAAGALAWQRAQFVAASQLVAGSLTGYADGPNVVFKANDGREHTVHGLGGSQSAREPGDAVPVRYLPADPALSARIADFQNLWGGVFAFGVFGALPLVFGLFFGALTLQEARVRRVQVGSRPALSPTRERLGANLTVAGNIVIVAGFATSLFAGGEDLIAVGRLFLIIGVGTSVHALAFWLRRDGDWQAPAICLIIALGFSLFGGGAMLLAR
jgi:hypothetical protein